MTNAVRNRPVYLVWLVLVIAAGLFSRSGHGMLPHFFAEYGGDTLWALMVFLIFGLVFKRFSSTRLAVFAVVFSVAIECSQLYHAPWIDAVRSFPLGGAVLGYGFLWSDLICYFAGILFGFLLEILVLRGGLSMIPLFTDQRRKERKNGMDG